MQGLENFGLWVWGEGEIGGMKEEQYNWVGEVSFQHPVEKCIAVPSLGPFHNKQLIR